MKGLLTIPALLVALHNLHALPTEKNDTKVAAVQNVTLPISVPQAKPDQQENPDPQERQEEENVVEEENQEAKPEEEADSSEKDDKDEDEAGIWSFLFDFV